MENSRSGPDLSNGLPAGGDASGWSQWVPSNSNLNIAKVTHGVAKGLFRTREVGPVQINAVIQGNQLLLGDTSQLPPSHLTAGLICQRAGTTEVRQRGKTFVIGPGMMLTADAAYPFSVESIGMTHTNVIIFPRDLALQRMPNLFGEAGQIVGAEEPCLKLLLNLIDGIFELSDSPSAPRDTAVGEAIIALLKAIPTQAPRGGRVTHWRVKRALEKIELWMSEPSLCAEAIAQEQNVSRRRLDQLFLAEIDSTISSQINERRLTSAAADLCDPTLLNQRITTIALDAGFQDLSHFSRAFKARFGASPKDWRKKMIGKAGD